MTILAFFKHHRSGLHWIPALVVAILIFCLSATPGEEIGQSLDRLESALQSSPASPTLPVSPTVDPLKVGHGIGYFCLGMAVLYALGTNSRWYPGIALLLCSLYAVTDEVHQIFVPGRSASPRDILIDTCAALGGVAVLLGGWVLGNLNKERSLSRKERLEQ
jgi:VanZ family protein